MARKKMKKATREKIAKALRRYWRKLKPKERKDKGRKASEVLRKWHKEHETKKRREWKAKQTRKRKGTQRKAQRAVQTRAKKTRRKRLSARERIETYLASGRDALVRAGFDALIDSASHADGSTDVELRIVIPRGVDGRDILREWNSRIAIPGDTWVSIGWIFSPAGMTPEVRAEYERYFKALQVHAHYQRAGRWAVNVLGALSIYESLLENKRHKPEQLFIRVHWSADGERPE